MFDPSAIRSFVITGAEKYITYQGLISNDRNHFPDLATGLDTSKVPATIFLRQITTGSHLTLYSHAEQKKARYFVAEASAAPVELKYNQYYNDQHDAVERALYRGQLMIYINHYAPGNISLISKAGTVAFEDDPLEEIISKINGDTTVNANTRAHHSALRWFLGATMSYIHNSYQGVTSAGITSLPQVGAGFDIITNPDVQRLIFRTNFSVCWVNFKTTYAPVYPNESTTDDQFSFTVTPQLIYNVYNIDNFKVFIGAGASLNFSGYNNNNSTSDRKSDFWVSIPLQTGLAINKRWEASFTYAPYTKITQDSYNRASNRAFGLGAKFYLGK